MSPCTISGVALAAIFAASLGLAAQQPAEHPHSLLEDAWALQFAIAENLTLGAFAGSVISAKHHRTETRALRYGLTLSSVHMRARGDGPDQTEFTVGLAAHFLRYPTLEREPSSPVHLFWGVGPLARFHLNRVRSAQETDLDARVLGLGAGGTIGGEWFVRPRISLSGEYHTVLLVTFLSEPFPADWAVRLASEGVRFGVSAYFR